MKNIEKHFEELKANNKNISTTCVVFKFRTGMDSCANHKCRDCHLENLKWLNSEYVEPIKLTQFEYDLIWVTDNWDYLFNRIYHLREMKNKGYFKDVDGAMSISEILKNCEIIDND